MPCLRNSLTAEGGLECALEIYSVMELEACKRLFSNSYSCLKRSSENSSQLFPPIGQIIGKIEMKLQSLNLLEGPDTKKSPNYASI